MNNLTREDKIQALTEDIRSKIPRLIELTPGCILKLSKNDTIFYEIVKPIEKHKDLIFIYSYKNGGTYPFKENSLELKEFEIIGHEPMLNDVLKWYLDKTYNTDYTFNLIEGDIVLHNGTFNYREHKGVFIGLSKPYLKDWDNDVIDFLYDVLTKKI